MQICNECNEKNTVPPQKMLLPCSIMKVYCTFSSLSLSFSSSLPSDLRDSPRKYVPTFYRADEEEEEEEEEEERKTTITF